MTISTFSINPNLYFYIILLIMLGLLFAASTLLKSRPVIPFILLGISFVLSLITPELPENMQGIFHAMAADIFVGACVTFVFVLPTPVKIPIMFVVISLIVLLPGSWNIYHILSQTDKNTLAYLGVSQESFNNFRVVFTVALVTFFAGDSDARRAFFVVLLLVLSGYALRATFYGIEVQQQVYTEIIPEILAVMAIAGLFFIRSILNSAAQGMVVIVGGLMVLTAVAYLISMGSALVTANPTVMGVNEVQAEVLAASIVIVTEVRG